jgi:peptidylprolyl isomerase
MFDAGRVLESDGIQLKVASRHVGNLEKTSPMPGLQWIVVAGNAVNWEAAQAHAKPSAQARLPTSVELIEALVGEPVHWGFGLEGAVWADDSSRVDPTSDEIQIPGPAPADATAALVFVAPKAVERPGAPKKRNLTVFGYIDDAVFQQCTEAAAYLNSEYSDEYSIKVEKSMGFEFERRRDAIAASTDDSAVKGMKVFVHDADANTAVSGEDFVSQVLSTTNFRLFNLPADDPQSYQSLARVALRHHLRTTGSSFAWLLVKINDQVAGRIVVQLYSNICPKTCLNFLHLCRGDLPDTKHNGETVKLSYKGSKFYRVVKNGWIQGGDITGDKSGNGGMSIYGKHFPDESFDVPHDDAGTLGMANDGEHTNSSNFYITLKKSSWMDKRYVAFGRVVEGLNVVRAIHDAPVHHNQTPAVPIVIDDCGDVPLDR